MKIFISHSSLDKKVGSTFLQILLDCGIKYSDIVFTSDPRTKIPVGENIFDWLKNQLSETPLVINILSDNYFSSIACLNEMGASWIVGNKVYSIVISAVTFL